VGFRQHYTQEYRTNHLCVPVFSSCADGKWPDHMDCLDYSWWKTNYRGASIADFFADSGVALHAAIRARRGRTCGHLGSPRPQVTRT
jgi:hypothetical protein